MTNDPGTIDVAVFKWIIGGLSAFVLLLVAWIKGLLDKIEKLNESRINDLKDSYKTLKKHKGTEDSDA